MFLVNKESMTIVITIYDLFYCKHTVKMHLHVLQVIFLIYSKDNF